MKKRTIIMLVPLAGIVSLATMSAQADCLAEADALEQRLPKGQQGADATTTEKDRDETASASEDSATSGRSTSAGNMKEGDAKEEDKADIKGGSEAESKEEAVAAKGPEVEEGGGVTTYAEGGPAQPAENWFGDEPQRGKRVEERLVAARQFARQGDEQACREELEKARALIGE